MAKQTITQVQLTDDLDGSRADSTVVFGVGGANYEIELNKANRRAFEKSMAVYVGHARRSGKAGERRRLKVAPDRTAVRAWAQANGYSISPRGRIANEILAAFMASNS